MTLHAVGPAPVAGIAVTAGIVDLGCPHDFFRRLAFVEIEVQPDGVASCRGRVEPAVVQPELRVPGEVEEYSETSIQKVLLQLLLNAFPYGVNALVSSYH